MQLFTSLDYIKIAIAGAYGHDKKRWDARIKWTDKYMHKMEEMRKKADEPLLMKKAMNAYDDALNGVPSGYMMSLDCTASLLQLMSVLIGCRKTAENVNVVDTGRRADIYAKATKVMKKIVSLVSRKDVKPALMTHFYGSKRQPELLFGQGTPELAAFYETLEKELPGAVEVMQDIQSCWQPYALEHSWYMPDGHLAKVKVVQAVDKKIEIDEFDHKTFTYRMYENIGSKKGLSLAANVIHSIDGWIVREMVRKATKQGFEMLTIHDSFWCHPNHMNQVRRNYNYILAEINDSNMLGDILSQICGSKVSYERYDEIDSDKIRESNYSLS
jgi:hypothetical protein